MRQDLYLVRHGQTLFNTQNRIQGWCDSPLTELGKEQAAAASDWFEKNGITFDYCCSSTSERCCDTLEIITDQPYERRKGLKEMNFGVFEAQPEFLHAKYPAFLTYYKDYGGETGEEVALRMQNDIRNILSHPERKSVLAVTHAGSIMNFAKSVGIDLDHSALSNGSVIHIICEDGNYRLAAKTKQGVL